MIKKRETTKENGNNGCGDKNPSGGVSGESSGEKTVSLLQIYLSAVASQLKDAEDNRQKKKEEGDALLKRGKESPSVTAVAALSSSSSSMISPCLGEVLSADLLVEICKEYFGRLFPKILS